MTQPLQRVSRLRVRSDTARAEFIEAIHNAYKAGATMRSIAEASGLSHQRIHQILHGR